MTKPMMQIKKNGSALLLAFGAFAVVSQARATTLYDAATQFSLASNPAGVWSYGAYVGGNVPGNFTLDGFASPDSGGQAGYWSENATPLPGVFHNGTANPEGYLNSGTVLVNPGELGFHPGPTGDRAVIRFIVPSAGLYEVSAEFYGLDFVGPTSTDVHVEGGAFNYSGSVSTYRGTPSTYSSGPAFFAQGDVIDFSVGSGGNGYLFDSTAVSAQVTAVPEPSAYALATGLTLLGFVGLRRIQAAKG